MTSIWQIIGVILVAAPFVALFVAIWRQEGFREALIIYAIGFSVAGVVTLGAALLSGDLP